MMLRAKRRFPVSSVLPAQISPRSRCHSNPAQTSLTSDKGKQVGLPSFRVPRHLVSRRPVIMQLDSRCTAHYRMLRVTGFLGDDEHRTFQSQKEEMGSLLFHSPCMRTLIGKWIGNNRVNDASPLKAAGELSRHLRPNCNVYCPWKTRSTLGRGSVQ